MLIFLTLYGRLYFISCTDKEIMKFIKPLIILTWVSCISTVIGYMHSWHMADFTPNNLKLSNLANSIPEVEEYGVIHFLTPACSCC